MLIGTANDAFDYPLKHRDIHIMSDSDTCLRELQSLPTKPKAVPQMTADLARQIAALNEHNTVHMHFVPGHCGIELNEKVDKLAKEATKDTNPIQHSPLPATYKSNIKTKEKKRTRRYIKKHVKDSRFIDYPPREGFKKILTDKETQDEYFEYERYKRHPLLNRARTGHNASRVHLHNVHIEENNTCRHCDQYPETLEHQILHCDKLQQKLARQREKYHSLNPTTFNDALWQYPIQITRILKKAKSKGVHI